MKELLGAIKTRLQTDTDLSYIDDSNIVIVPDIDIIPYTLTFPAITLKDNRIHRENRINLRWKVHLYVSIVILQLLEVGDTSVMSQIDPKIYGVLEIAEAIHKSLNNNTLSITGMQSAEPVPDEMESETIGYEELVLQRKVIGYEYLKDVSQ